MAKRYNSEMPDPETFKEIMDMVAEKLPSLLEKLSDVLYGEPQAKKFGKAVSIFYNELKDTGMTREQIFELTKGYMSTLNIGATIGQMGKNMRGHRHGHGSSEFGGEKCKEDLDEGHKDD